MFECLLICTCTFFLCVSQSQFFGQRVVILFLCISRPQTLQKSKTKQSYIHVFGVTFHRICAWNVETAIFVLFCNQVFLSESHWCLIITCKYIKHMFEGIFILVDLENVTLKESKSYSGNRQRVSWCLCQISLRIHVRRRQHGLEVRHWKHSENNFWVKFRS